MVVYQVLVASGAVESEHETRVAAQTRASSVPGARLRTVTRVK